MSTSLALSLIALFVSLWALYWRRRAAMAAERSADQAAKSAASAEASAGAATRSATAAEKSAATSAEALTFSKEQALQDAVNQREKWIADLVREGIQEWPRRGQLYHIVNREASLTNDEIRELVHRVYAGRRGTAAQAEEHLKHVLEQREKHLRGA